MIWIISGRLTRKVANFSEKLATFPAQRAYSTMIVTVQVPDSGR